ncbi:hypothetical protein VTN31DRAFT_1975 [Thermomyces dupontii]|uniref:uncharacterized protein n=1 Tax=Talaromyces thermophilus TaxID=28565 RepID=UPI0037441711
MSRAAMFQDEKRRIISSCFSRLGNDGVLIESYITHIRVTEDSVYASAPAPPYSPPENRKSRVIVVAVRKSGRVRMHKARENDDGSFSIGKTWMLDDLTAVQVYDNLKPTSALEQQQKQWASNVGVVVTIGKAYYWQTANYKERDFFIGSLVKIFKKYTGGKVPRLIGFDEKQRYALVGDAPEVQQPPSQPPQAHQQVPPRAGRDPTLNKADDTPEGGRRAPLPRPPREPPRISTPGSHRTQLGSATLTPVVDVRKAEPEPRQSSPEPISPLSMRNESATRSSLGTAPSPLEESSGQDEFPLPAERVATPVAEPAAEEVPPKPLEEPAKEENEDDEPVETHRPGLGPMVRKKSRKDVAGAFRRAATAYGAFKPRAGGAGERLLAMAKKAKSNEPDAITSVVPAPHLRNLSADSTKTPPTSFTDGTQSVPSDQELALNQPPENKADEAKDAPSGVQTQDSILPPQALEHRRKRLEENVFKYCQALDINPSLLDMRAAELDEILTLSGWSGRLHDGQTIQDVEANIRRETGRVQATSWLGHVEQQEKKVAQLALIIDEVIQECDELDGLLTLYARELSTAHEDITFLEAQSGGLQVQAANQKLLQRELRNLLNDTRPWPLVTT